MRPLQQPIPLSGAFGDPRVATHFGEGAVSIGAHTLHVPNLVFMPALKDTLLSYVRLTREGHRIEVLNDSGTFIDKGGGVRLKLSGAGNILTFDAVQEPTSYDVNAVTRSAMRETVVEIPPDDPTLKREGRRRVVEAASPIVDPPATPHTSAGLIHARYGHLCLRKLLQLAKSGVVQLSAVSIDKNGVKVKASYCEQNCDACRLGKMVRPKFADEFDHKATRPNEKVVGDVCGPIWVVEHPDGTITKFSMSTLTDVYSRHLEVLIIETKDQASDHCISYYHRAKIQTRNEMVHFHTDGGTEYNRFERVAMMRGTKVTRTPVDTPERNAIAERKNRTIIEMARALLFHARLNPVEFGRAAIETAVVIHNRCTIVSKHGKTMHELYTGHAPDLSFMRVFGCDAFVLVHKPESKLSARSEKGIFIGYDMRREFCYRVKIGGSDRVVVSRDVRFEETSFTVDREIEAGGSAVPNGATRESQAKIGDGARASEKQERTTAAIAEFGSRIYSAPTSSSSSGGVVSSLRHTRDRSRESASADRVGPDVSGGDADLDEGDTSSSSNSSEIDRRTRVRLEKAAARAEEGPSTSSSASGSSLRRTGRMRQSSKQTGLNLDDFGQVALTVSPDVSTSNSSRLDVFDVSQVNSSESTSTHDAATIPHEKIRVADVPIPSTRKVAMKSQYAKQWRAAMDQEHASLIAHGTYRLVARPFPSPNLVSCKWVFSVKEKDGFVVRFKARLVARGFTQEKGIDFDETYSPVLKYKTLRMILAIVAAYGYKLELMDVQTAYLHASLRETVYMQQPEGYEQDQTVQGGGRETARPLVCLLLKALYGLKQAGREWNIHLDAFVRSLGFNRCVSDTCVYVKKSTSGRPMVLSVYVDDIPSAYAVEDSFEWGRVKEAFFAKFKITFQAEADWLLNMRITRDPSRNRLMLDQQAYVETMLEDLGMDDCKPTNHPGAQEELSMKNNASSESDLAQMRNVPYRRAVGLLMYLSNTSRPDITHAVGMVARYANNPGPAHWRAVKAILRYLSGTSDYGLLFESSSDSSSSSSSSSIVSSKILLTAYADADWGGCKDTGRSTTGWVLKFGNSIIDWSSKKQQTVALSSCESEYMAISEATQAVVWAKNLLHELGLQPLDARDTNQHTAPLHHHSLEVYNDNKSAIAMAHNDVHHKRSKHIRLRHHFIREAVSSGLIALKWCSTHAQLADVLTKVVPCTTFIRLRDELVFPRAIITSHASDSSN